MKTRIRAIAHTTIGTGIAFMLMGGVLLIPILLRLLRIAG